jgi:hypothetical protein
MNYYLDTVTARTLSKELPKLKYNSYTSALVILELISGINEREFYLRKQVIQNLFDCQFPIIWKLPETIRTEAFTIIEITETRSSGLKQICLELLKSENLKTLIANTKNEIYNIDFFKELDQMYSEGFIESTLKGNDELKKIYNDQKVDNGEAFENYAKQLVKSLPSNVEINKAITIKAIAGKLSDLASNDDDHISEEEIYNSYDNSIDTFLTAFSLFSSKKSAELSMPAKNDYVDLIHLLYLRNNPNCYIVTDDKMILNITPQAKTIQEFKKINGI